MNPCRMLPTFLMFAYDAKVALCVSIICPPNPSRLASACMAQLLNTTVSALTFPNHTPRRLITLLPQPGVDWSVPSGARWRRARSTLGTNG